TYRDQAIVVTTSDDGSSSADVTFKCSTGTCLLTGLAPTTPTGWTSCAAGCSTDAGTITSANVYKAAWPTTPVAVTETKNWTPVIVRDQPFSAPKYAEFHINTPILMVLKPPTSGASPSEAITNVANSYYYDAV